jgi:hypothetical protein
MKRLIFVLVCAIVFSGSVMAGVVNVDFGAAGLYSGTAAASDTGTTWNQGVWNGTTPNLMESDGTTVSTVDVTITNPQSYYATGITSTLMKDYIYRLNGTIFVDISGLAENADYDLYLYSAGGAAGATFTFGTETATASGSPAAEPWTLGGNYVVLSVTSDAAGEISGEFSNGTNYATLNGMQIVPVPEPATMALLGLGALVLRRRKK